MYDGMLCEKQRRPHTVCIDMQKTNVEYAYVQEKRGHTHRAKFNAAHPSSHSHGIADRMLEGNESGLKVDRCTCLLPW